MSQSKVFVSRRSLAQRARRARERDTTNVNDVDLLPNSLLGTMNTVEEQCVNVNKRSAAQCARRAREREVAHKKDLDLCPISSVGFQSDWQREESDDMVGDPISYSSEISRLVDNTNVVDGSVPTSFGGELNNASKRSLAQRARRAREKEQQTVSKNHNGRMEAQKKRRLTESFNKDYHYDAQKKSKTTRKIPDYNGTTQIIDVIGVISSWKPLRATENSLVREIIIKDQSGRDATLMLWDNAAREFDITKLTNKNVLILTSANVATLRGRKEICVMSKAWSCLYIDLDIEQVKNLRDITPEIDIGQLPKNNDILHWKDANRKTIADVTTQFGKDGIEVLFTCQGKITKYISLYEYLAHKQCHCKVDEVNGSFYCKKHGAITDYYQSGNVKLEIAYETGRQVVALFSKQIEALIGMDMETIVEYNQNNIQIGDLFEEAFGNEYVFELKVKNIGEMTMTMTKFMKIEKKANKPTITEEEEEKDNNKRKRQEEEDEVADCSNGKSK